MKRYWPLLVIAVILTAVIGVSQYAESAQEHCEERTSKVKAAAIAKGDDSAASNDAENPCKPPVWARYFAWPEGVGAWAVIFTLIVIAWQSVETRKAAQATQLAADAALKQADHMVASERAWVTAEIFQDDADPSDMRVWEKPPNYGLGVPVRIKNIGETPARIVESYARCELVRNADPHKLPYIPVLPEAPDYTTDAEQNRIMEKRRMLMPGQTYDYLITLPPLFFEQHLLQYRNSDRLLCVYGFVRYESFGAERETRFCYAYIFNRPLGGLTHHKTGKLIFPPAYCISGPEVYNRVT